MKNLTGKSLNKKKKSDKMLYGNKTKKETLKENKEYKDKQLNEEK